MMIHGNHARKSMYTKNVTP